MADDRVAEPERDVNDRAAWADFLAKYVDYHHGKGISDKAFDAWVMGKEWSDD